MIYIEPKKIYMAAGITDLRKGIDGYALIIQDQFKLDPTDRSLYLFCNREHNKLKCLYWDGSGFWLFYKRLEKGHFKWKKTEDQTAIEISEQQLRWLLEGLHVDQNTSVKEISNKYV